MFAVNYGWGQGYWLCNSAEQIFPHSRERSGGKWVGWGGVGGFSVLYIFIEKQRHATKNSKTKKNNNNNLTWAPHGASVAEIRGSRDGHPIKRPCQTAHPLSPSSRPRHIPPQRRYARAGPPPPRFAPQEPAATFKRISHHILRRLNLSFSPPTNKCASISEACKFIHGRWRRRFQTNTPKSATLLISSSFPILPSYMAYQWLEIISLPFLPVKFEFVM